MKKFFIGIALLGIITVSLLSLLSNNTTKTDKNMLQLQNIAALSNEENIPEVYERDCFDKYTEYTTADDWYMEIYICKFCGQTRYATAASELSKCLQIVYPTKP